MYNFKLCDYIGFYAMSLMLVLLAYPTCCLQGNIDVHSWWKFAFQLENLQAELLYALVIVFIFIMAIIFWIAFAAVWYLAKEVIKEKKR